MKGVNIWICWFFVLLDYYQVSGLTGFTSKYDGKTEIGLVGSSINFTWSFTSDVVKVQWGLKQTGVDSFVNDGVLVFLDKTGPVSLSVPSAYKGRVSSKGDISSGQVIFTLSSIRNSDERLYGCSIESTAVFDNLLFDAVSLKIKEKPQINISSLQSSYNEGSSVNISCTASGKPHPDVQWIRNGNVESSGKKRAFLTFSSIKRADNGQYTCRGSNAAGSDEIRVTLVVHYKPEGTTLNTSAADNTVTQGKSVTFTCHVTEAKPQVSHYKFYLNDTSLVKDDNDNQYTINNVQRSQHYGKYKCVPRNDVGDGPQATVTLNVHVPVQFTVFPQNVTVNETNPIVVNCDASGFPEPSFTWKKDGQVLSQPKQLNIQSSHRSNTGLYMCTASNGVGQERTRQAYVTVQYSPTIKETTTSTDKSWIGQTVTLKCVSDGVPTPTLTWFKGESQINSTTDTQNTVNVKMNSDQDFGAYKCVADNGLTPADFKEVNIEQIKKPGSPTIAQLDIQATSLTVKWTVPADDGGSPIIAYRVVILKGDTEIKNVDITDPGTTSWNAGGLERDTNYTVKVLARNAVFEGRAVEKAVKTKYEEPGDGGGDGTQTGGGGDDGNGMGAAIYAGAAAAGVLLIIGIIVTIVLWRRRKQSSHEDTSGDELGSANPYEIEDGYQSVSREAAQNLQASGPAAEPNYAQVDPSRKKKNRRPPSDEYAQVDKSKKTKKKKKPGELDYADLGDLRADIQLAPVPSGAAAAAAAPVVRPPAYEGTEYAEISQFGVPQPDPTYANVPKKEVVYSNVESM